MKCIQHTMKKVVIRTLKKRIFKYIKAVSKNVHLDVLRDIFDKYNNTVHRTIKMKPIEVTSDFYAEYNDDHVRISKYKTIFAQRYTQNWSKEVFVISKIKNTVPWTYMISDLNGEKIDESFYEKELLVMKC